MNQQYGLQSKVTKVYARKKSKVTKVYARKKSRIQLPRPPRM